MRSETGKPSSSSFEGDFAPGEVLIGRYRVVALVGEGGMGQVYLADDLVLGQPVAVKFLPAHVAEREGGLERFRAEVRHSRDVTHPNVARVHDIGEVDGRHFLTMEFVDGEDLASLIRRIGRLPREKAAEIAQQICAGLAEAHRRGVLHRDLKPANVMLDGEGRVKLTDFGLAVAAETEAGATVAGTPQYMAPEQLSGVPASVQSEVYSLGLLLYELYTGKRALRGRTLDELRREHEEGAVSPPSSVLADIEPGVDAVLSRCLARDPRERPASVAEVARALPGGDPLAAALAAGVTPSPEVVAAADSRGAVAPRRALALLLGAALLLVALVVTRERTHELTGASYGKPTAVLQDRARELVEEWTGAPVPEHAVHWYAWDSALAEARTPAPSQPPEALFQPLVHHARFSPEPITWGSHLLTADMPSPAPGSIYVALDADGRVLAWRHHLGPDLEVGEPAAAAPDAEAAWRARLERTGLDLEALRPVEPRRRPTVFADARLAWEVGAPDAESGDVLRVEGAQQGGQPVQLNLVRGEEALGAALGAPPRGGMFLWVQLALTALAALLAWRSVRAGRADLHGGLIVGAVALGSHVVFAFAMPTPDEFVAFGTYFSESLSYSCHTAVRVALFYLALEPFARRRWPHTLVSWSRLLEGRVRDPAVGRELLVGLFAGLAMATAVSLVSLGFHVVGTESSQTLALPFSGLGSPLRTFCSLVHLSGDAVMISGAVVFILVLLRAVIPVAAVANALWLALSVTISTLASGGAPDAPIVALTFSATLLLLLTRVGFLSVVAAQFVLLSTTAHPLTLRPGDWYFPGSLVLILTLATLGALAYRVAVAGRSAFEPEPPGAR